MPEQRTPDTASEGWVLHVCPRNGGGVDRFVRDVCARRPLDWVVHVSDDQCVLEHPAFRRMVFLNWDQLRQTIHNGAMGSPLALHAHSTEPNIRRFCSMWSPQTARVVTLHDVGFVGRGDEPLQVEERHRFLLGAQALTAPSAFIVHQLQTTRGLEHLNCCLVENGADEISVVPGAAQVAAEVVFPVAVVGAIGAHKGWAYLEALVASLPPSLPLVLLGYAEQRLTQGWWVPGRLWVHGAFQLENLPELLRHYGVQLAFFPPGQPESYCYALSDVWHAGLPALVPDIGALGERMHTHSGGETYDASCSPDALALTLQKMVACLEDKPSVDCAKASIHSVEAMVKKLDVIYKQHGLSNDVMQPQIDALQSNAETHLNSAFFRRELINLSGQLAQLTRERDAALSELEQLAKTQDDRMRWQAHLERDIETLNQQVRALHQAHMDAAVRTAEIEKDHTLLKLENTRLKTRIEKLMVWLPSGISRYVLKKLISE